MAGNIQQGIVKAGPGSLWCKYANRQLQQESTATWTFDQPPATLVEGRAYSWALSATSDSASNAPTAPNVTKAVAKMSSVGNSQGPTNNLETKYVTYMLSDQERQMGNAAGSDSVRFIFEPNRDEVRISVSGCEYLGEYNYAYERDPSATGAGPAPGAAPGARPGPGPGPGPGPDAGEPVFLSLYEWQAQRVVQADGWLSGVVRDPSGNIIGVHRRRYLRTASSAHDPTQPLAFQNTRGFYIGPETYEPLPSPMATPTNPALIEREINDLLMQINVWQQRELAARNSGDAAEYARAQAALPGLQLRLRVLNFLQMNNK